MLQKHLDKSGSSSVRTEVLARAAPGHQKKRRGRARRSNAAIAAPDITPHPAGVASVAAVRAGVPDAGGAPPGRVHAPPLSLLDRPREQHKFDERELMDSARLLEEKCREFSVEGSVVQIHPGPVVTTFEFKPDAGVKYSRVTGLADDLCLAMQAESVLIERLPGKSTVGIQIPNRNAGTDLVAPDARVRALPAVELQADARAGSDDPR